MVVVGLGNPGPRYARTRHNAGFLVLDAVARELGVRFRTAWFRGYLHASRERVPGGERDHLAKPLTYMNRSGDVAADLLRRAGGGAEGLLVVCDNVDLPPGACRLKLRGSGGGGHRGIESMQAALGSGEFMRLSVGVGRPAAGGELAEYVLSEPEGPEAEAFREGLARAAQALLELLGGADPAKVMNELNRRNGSAPA